MKRVLLTAMAAALLSSPALAQGSDWTIGSRTLPAPAGFGSNAEVQREPRNVRSWG